MSAAYGLDHAAVATVVEMLLLHQSLTLQEPDVVAAALAIYRRKPALGFWDCFVPETARKADHLPLGTFDKNLGKIAGTERI